MTEETIMESVSGSIWGPSGPKRKEETMIEARTEERKPRYLNKIMGELEAFVERPGEEWGDDEEKAIWDILNAVENTVKAQLSSNNPEYTG